MTYDVEIYFKHGVKTLILNGISLEQTKAFEAANLGRPGSFIRNARVDENTLLFNIDVESVAYILIKPATPPDPAPSRPEGEE